MKQSAEERKIASLARQYRNEGYKVYAQLKGYSKPELFGDYQPDLVVTKRGETIIIEVETSSTAKERKRAIEEFAKRAAEAEGVRFDLVITKSRLRRSTRESRNSKLLRKLYRGILNTLDLTIDKQPYAFYILCGLLLEHLLITLAEKRDIERSPRLSPPQLADRLTEEGVISSSVREFAIQLWQQRNAAVHGHIRYISGTNQRDARDKIVSLVKNYGSVDLPMLQRRESTDYEEDENEQ